MKPAARLLCLILSGAALAGAQPASPDLARFADASVWRLHNRSASGVPDRAPALRLDAREGDGVAWLVGSDFADGTITLDLRGANKPGQSFVGVAFRGVDDTTFDAVYFRPFNFKNPEVPRRARAVQYISMPAHPWEQLRRDHPGRYEAAVSPVPDPDGWFHARIVVANRTVRVFVNDAREPCLTVTELGERRGGAIGLWVGNGSAGDFANLTVTPRLQP